MSNLPDIYDQQYLQRLHSLEIKRKVILDILRNYKKIEKEKLEVLIKNLEHPDKVGLKKINPLIFSFLIDSLLNIRENLEVKIAEFEKSRISRYVLFEILFWSKPSSYPFPNEKISNYRSFVQQKREKAKKMGVENFLQLYALESVERDTFLKEIKSTVLKIRPENLEEYLWVRDFVEYLTPIEKENLRQKLHPYVWKILISKSTAIPIVIDGNNVLMSPKLKFPEKIDSLLEYIARLNQTYFPFFIVFDENAKYKFRTKYFEYKRVYYHSPADELIIGLAKELGGVVCSQDRFKDYADNIKNIWYELGI
ncbi:MAG: ribonuclease [Fervidobacterium sp.]|uniref:Uncharacterized protein n=1 Tax=Fervidobacterium gondwanense DSM 13020 TaxID=1121883 RepID=A0A1M7T9T2_FERGO|nr:ribonuclease [Fervidobacterium gondwanense]UXF01029.1 ribonuclease [Fervidobacterium riparium]SHN67472.1 hypothetical protein SAMN02745226_01751 [Fervidobacterium gondwanense DSM 13020]